MKIIDGGITAVKGFLAAGAPAGIKKGRNDMAMIFSEAPAVAAATFTKNVVKAAPVYWNQEIYHKYSTFRAFVINAGNANACTGELGKQHVRQEAEAVAACLGIKPEEVFVCSTGVIGVPMPIDKVLPCINVLCKSLGSTIADGTAASKAIMTTDTVNKEIAVEVMIGDKPVRIAGMCKGAGMIHPNMATMLGFIVSDIKIDAKLLQKAHSESIEASFNMISVDRDTSTNDQVTVLANGMANNTPITEENVNYAIFKEALDFINTTLAKKIVYDGEGASKFLAVHVQGAKSIGDARILAKSVITSNLVKSAFFGCDANWGRILAALGYSGVVFNPEKVTIRFENKVGQIELMTVGTPVKFDEEFALKILKEREINIEILMQEGSAEATAWGCDLTYDYVKINGDYRT